ncbi:MAG TPA: amidase [Gemmataceae bacterium]|jgi:aspartyl-tRNA(Asn)/glutamyl-tRNA(Gln) amidotransferase subunit A
MTEPLTIHVAAATMRAGPLTPVDLLDQCLARIDRYEPAVQAWVVIDRDGAREQAERLTAELKRSRHRGPLHGIPIGVKDIIDVFDLPTGCGSKLWANSVARQDATVVKRLRQAGAVILGKTVTTAYAYLDPPVTRNPWDAARTPGGSSSGSAAAVACGMCLAALGTQTVGSLTRPAGYCGVCALKPSVWVAGSDGVLPLAPTLDHVGALARCVTDLALLADVLIDDAPDCAGRVRRAVGPNADRPPPVHLLGGMFQDRAEPVMRAAMGRVRDALRGLSCRDDELPAVAADLPRHLRAILATEAADYHGDRLRRHPDDYPPKIRELIEDGLRTATDDYRAALDHRNRMREAIDGGYFCEPAVLVTPATTGPAPDGATTGDGVFNAPWSYCGLPTVSLPCGRAADGLPVGVQLVGGVLGAADAVDIAARLEKELGVEMGLPPVPQ